MKLTNILGNKSGGPGVFYEPDGNFCVIDYVFDDHVEPPHTSEKDVKFDNVRKFMAKWIKKTAGQPGEGGRNGDPMEAKRTWP